VSEQEQQFTAFVASCLGETLPHVVASIGRIVAALGADRVKALLKETLEIEQNGGLMVVDGSRRRTIGGTWFFLVKRDYSTILPLDIWPIYTKKRQPGASVNPPQPQLKPFAWEERIEALQDIAQGERGVLSTVKITVIGRPGRIVDKGQCVIISLTDSKLPSLPKGLPVPSSTTQNYTLYVAAKQWKKVAEAIADPTDSLIVEGYPQLDSKTESIAVFATNVTTKNLQAAKRKAEPGGEQA
jgi:PHAX RNA-binding domain